MRRVLTLYFMTTVEVLPSYWNEGLQGHARRGNFPRSICSAGTRVQTRVSPADA